MTCPKRSFIKIRLGFSNAYLLRGKERTILVDAGSLQQEGAFVRNLERHGISAYDIALIVVTHAHFDHVGSLKAIQQHCQCPVAIHEEEARLVRQGAVVFPPGTNLFGKAASYLGKRLIKSFFRFPAMEPDIIISQDFSLEPFGILGNIISTKGHTEGSLSVLLASGEAFVGDLAANYLPFGLGPIFPPFAENVSDLLTSWRRVLALGARIICPGHGKPFKAEWLEKRLG
ncbi:MAG: MBL fold metallo-hydrolase [Thermodesulfobacteriota bacterium]|nr:MBL fold metallo-hydrolase [Thermodesulfobacteriota bacterium]